MECLNVGCGNRFLEDWTNIDFIKTGKNVISYDLYLGIPFDDNAFDVVYHSHVLEHFPKKDGAVLLNECYRVLKPGGILRIAVPNLEQIANEYLANLKFAIDNPALGRDNYEWTILELFDQMVRNKSGGDMAKYWRQEKISNEEYIIKRTGSEFLSYRKNLITFNEIENLPKRKLCWKEKLVIYLTGEKKAWDYMEIGKFRSYGETHQWMYDQYSLTNLLAESKFTDIIRVDGFNSSIPNWIEFRFLDIENDNIRKPDSLFMEAKK